MAAAPQGVECAFAGGFPWAWERFGVSNGYAGGG
jgi:hypothetical protein